MQIEPTGTHCAVCGESIKGHVFPEIPAPISRLNLVCGECYVAAIAYDLTAKPPEEWEATRAIWICARAFARSEQQVSDDANWTALRKTWMDGHSQKVVGRPGVKTYCAPLVITYRAPIQVSVAGEDEPVDWISVPRSYEFDLETEICKSVDRSLKIKDGTFRIALLTDRDVVYEMPLH